MCLDQTYPKVSFCTTCMGRRHHLERTLRKNIEDNLSYPNVEFVLLDYNSQDGLQDWVRQNFFKEIASGRLKYVYYPDAQQFHHAHAKNMAHRMASGDILVNLDADNFTGPGFASYIVRTMQAAMDSSRHARCKGVFMRPQLDQYAAAPYHGTAGRIALTHDAFYEVGGYPEQFDRWGGEDTALTVNLRGAGYREIPMLDQSLEGIAHSDEERVAHTGQDPSTLRADAKKRWSDLKSGTNHGHIGCGKVYVNFLPKPIEIAPAPEAEATAKPELCPA